MNNIQIITRKKLIVSVIKTLSYCSVYFAEIFYEAQNPA